jgi:DegV family protein with EDD domain
VIKEVTTMGRIAVVTDSTSDIPPQVADSLGISVLPAKIMFGKQEFRDGIDITTPEFFRRLREAHELPTTSQPSPEEFAEVYRDLSRSAESILSIHISEELSGTLASAYAAKAQLDLPMPVHIVDSRSTSMGLGLQVLAAARWAANGVDAARIVERIRALSPRTSLLFVVDTLEYLHKGGRIGGAQRLLGSVLSLKPILHIIDGRIDTLEKTRTKRRALKRTLDIMGTRVRDAQAIHAAVVHADTEDEALRLRQEIETRFPCVEMHTCELCPALGVHTGPGTMAVAFYGENA